MLKNNITMNIQVQIVEQETINYDIFIRDLQEKLNEGWELQGPLIVSVKPWSEPDGYDGTRHDSSSTYHQMIVKRS